MKEYENNSQRRSCKWSINIDDSDDYDYVYVYDYYVYVYVCLSVCVIPIYSTAWYYSEYCFIVYLRVGKRVLRVLDTRKIVFLFTIFLYLSEIMVFKQTYSGNRVTI